MNPRPSKLIVALAALTLFQTAYADDKSPANTAEKSSPYKCTLVSGCDPVKKPLPAAPADPAAPTAAVPAPAAAPDVIRTPSMLANTCAGCHGTNGHSAGETMPSLAGLDERYFVKTMQDFKSGARPSTIMGRLARGYSDREVKELADFFANQEWVSAKAEFDPKLAKEGQKIHKENCESCHEQGGAVNGSKETPRIAGQWRAYLNNLLIDLHDIKRSSTQPLKMRQRVQKLSQEEIEALSHYYASQQEEKK
ncbi:c-type cytochrome [Thiothrix nivea]|uniref:Cytochrome c class I n=1 Tax=Thiothrix nivea (strain ATCC 35100 / DSM 5205 / JP2) TaxID=870187 RepID=A0A656HEG0_THINJ|nr:c-type cytochrome [Thiothrix nivea]EIJ33856.1 cytochrome c class I [Thiothrix nivea DSM 5205]